MNFYGVPTEELEFSKPGSNQRAAQKWRWSQAAMTTYVAQLVL